MGRGVDADPGSNQHFIADGGAIAIEQHTVVVDEDLLADGNVVAIVTPEGRFEDGSLQKRAVLVQIAYLENTV